MVQENCLNLGGGGCGEIAPWHSSLGNRVRLSPKKRYLFSHSLINKVYCQALKLLPIWWVRNYVRVVLIFLFLMSEAEHFFICLRPFLCLFFFPNYLCVFCSRIFGLLFFLSIFRSSLYTTDFSTLFPYVYKYFLTFAFLLCLWCFCQKSFLFCFY